MWALFTVWLHQPQRHFVLLDNQGICRALRCCSEPPSSTLWIETCAFNESWLNRPLPEHVRHKQA